MTDTEGPAIWDRALDVFGDEEAARSWMKTPREIFGGRPPEVLVEIRIDYGVRS